MSDFDTGYKYGVNESMGEIKSLRKTVTDYQARYNGLLTDYMKVYEILQDFISTTECKRTWVDEMQGTIEAVLKEIDNTNKSMD